MQILDYKGSPAILNGDNSRAHILKSKGGKWEQANVADVAADGEVIGSTGWPKRFGEKFGKLTDALHTLALQDEARVTLPGRGDDTNRRYANEDGLKKGVTTTTSPHETNENGETTSPHEADANGITASPHAAEGQDASVPDGKDAADQKGRTPPTVEDTGGAAPNSIPGTPGAQPEGIQGGAELVAIKAEEKEDAEKGKRRAAGEPLGDDEVVKTASGRTVAKAGEAVRDDVKANGERVGDEDVASKTTAPKEKVAATEKAEAGNVAKATVKKSTAKK